MHVDTSKGACDPVCYPIGSSGAVDSDDARGRHAEGAGSVPSEHVSDRDRVSVCKKEGREEGKKDQAADCVEREGGERERERESKETRERERVRERGDGEKRKSKERG